MLCVNEVIGRVPVMVDPPANVKMCRVGACRSRGKHQTPGSTPQKSRSQVVELLEAAGIQIHGACSAALLLRPLPARMLHLACWLVHS
jgi:hypothetical protein